MKAKFTQANNCTASENFSFGLIGNLICKAHSVIFKLEKTKQKKEEFKSIEFAIAAKITHQPGIISVEQLKPLTA